MEQILARLLFSALDANEETKEKVIRLLKFYRENRELLLLLMNAQKTQDAQETQIHTDEKTGEPQKESRPQETVGSISVMEEYLNRAV